MSDTISLGRWSKRLLFTGAGFSKDFRGKLAWEFLAALMVHPKVISNDALTGLLRDEMNYENALDVCAKNPAYQSHRADLESAVLDVYLQMDGAMTPPPYFDIDNGQFQNFIRRFWGAKQSPDSGYIFTLNHDILVERVFEQLTYRSEQGEQPLRCPGVPVKHFEVAASPEPFQMARHFIDITFSETESSGNVGNFNYIKLHGSFNWRTEDGSLMIVGGDKDKRTDDIPLLSCYKRIFRAALAEAESMFIVGYSFADVYINRIINAALESNDGLRIFILNPMSPQQLFKTMIENEAQPIWDHCIPLSYRLIDMMPKNLPVMDWENICRAFFGD